MPTRIATALALLIAGAGALAGSVAGDVRPDERRPYLSIDSALAVGNKGEEILDVSVPAVCGRTLWAFDHAELRIARNRYGGAQFVTLPPPGCLACGPLVVRWYHEPTGHLSFDVEVFRRPVRLPCDGAEGPAEAASTQPR